MIEFNKINFGESDADTEAERSPKDFSDVFFDPNNYLSELLEGISILYGEEKEMERQHMEQKSHLMQTQNPIMRGKEV